MKLHLHKCFLSFLVCMLPAMAWADDYPVAFDKNANRTHAERKLNSITLNGNIYRVKNIMKMYHDLTDSVFYAHAGDIVSPALGFTGRWMDSYIYIDKDCNGQFDVTAPEANGLLTDDNELVSFSGLTLSGGGYNSYGEVTNLSQVQPPSFTLPASLQPGLYRMRIKVDWDSTDPAGRMDNANSILKNGGAIADITLQILPAGKQQVGKYVMVFNDEFNQPDGSRPDDTKWKSSVRRGSTWNRFISDTDEVAFIDNGHLVCRAIANTDKANDPVDMLTGSMETQNKYSFTYGRAEARLKTLPHRGNFPAFWMMPQPPTQKWPNGGEIDIFEAIDAQATAFHTLHSHWINDLGNKNNPKYSFNENVTQGEWHIFAVEWTKDLITFFVDGTSVGSYAKSINASHLENGQWPFDHAFYLILNQSVGDGSWAQAPDLTFTYETRFDWVRVFQQVELTNGINDVTFSSQQASDAIYDLQGRKVRNDGETLAKGIYIINGKKWLVK